MAKYQSPGVFVEEIPKSHTISVRDSMAVFIGYTEKHIGSQGRDLRNTAVEISSMLDFENYFGTAQLEENIEIYDTSDSENVNITVSFRGAHSQHNLYYSVRQFFANGGQVCRIISVGSFLKLGESLDETQLILGLEALKIERRNYLIAVPETQNLAESNLYQLQTALLEFCARNESFAVLDLPNSLYKNILDVVNDYREHLQSPFLQFGATCCPKIATDFPYHYAEGRVTIKRNNLTFSLDFLKTTDSELYDKYKIVLEEFYVSLPPSGSVAGAIIRNDGDRGIWRAPANIPLMNVKGLETLVTNQQQQKLTVDASGKSINCIRNFPGRGNLIWGGRTLAGSDPEWKYIVIRRFANQIEIDISVGLEAFLFETNSAMLWSRTRSMIENYLINFWRMGALVGAKANQAFFVKCGLGETMTAEDVSDKKLLVQVGVAITRPAEFILISFSQLTA